MIISYSIYYKLLIQTLMKKLFLIASALFTAISFNACTNDDHENGGGDGGNRLVSQIIRQNEDGTTEIYKFYYDDQGRVIRIHYDDYATCFSYTEDKVEITESSITGNDDKYAWVIYLATLNGQGYITTSDYLMYDGNNRDCITSNYSYDKNGYLSKIWWDNNALQCTWNNGDLINEHYTEDSYEGTYEYTNYPRKQNIDIFEVSYGYYYDGDDFFIGAAGLVGRKNAHLIKSANFSSNNESDNVSLSYDYELNDNGNPTKITEFIMYKTTSKHETRTYEILYK